MYNTAFYRDVVSVTPKNCIFMLPTIFIKSIATLFSYATVWALLFHFLYHTGFLKQQQYSLLCISIIISVLGGLITYYYPKKALLPYFGTPFAVNDKYYMLVITDILFHQLPLLILLIRFDLTIPIDNFLLAAIFGTFYYLIFNPYKIYLLNTPNESEKNKKKQDVMKTLIDIVFATSSITLIIISCYYIYTSIKK